MTWAVFSFKLVMWVFDFWILFVHFASGFLLIDKFSSPSWLISWFFFWLICLWVLLHTQRIKVESLGIICFFTFQISHSLSISLQVHIYCYVCIYKWWLGHCSCSNWSCGLLIIFLILWLHFASGLLLIDGFSSPSLLIFLFVLLFWLIYLF